MIKERIWTTGLDLSADRRASFLAGTPVALMAGFTLASALVVVSQRPAPEHDPWRAWGPAAAAVLVGASGVFLIAMSLAGWAGSLFTTPEEAAMWFPDIADDKTRFEQLRHQVANGRFRSGVLINHALKVWCFGVGLTGAGLACALLSYGPGAGTTVAAVVAAVMGVAVASFSFLAEKKMTSLKNLKEPDPLTDRRHAELYGRRSDAPLMLLDVAAARGVGDVYLEARDVLRIRCELMVQCASLVAVAGKHVVIKLHPAVSRPGELLVTFDIAGISNSRGIPPDQVLTELKAPDAARAIGEHYEFIANVAPLSVALGIPAQVNS